MTVQPSSGGSGKVGVGGHVKGDGDGGEVGGETEVEI